MSTAIVVYSNQQQQQQVVCWRSAAGCVLEELGVRIHTHMLFTTLSYPQHTWSQQHLVRTLTCSNLRVAGVASPLAGWLLGLQL